MAVANFHDTNGHYPPPFLTDEHGKPMHSWRVLILPFIEQHALFAQYDFSEPWDGPKNRKLAPLMPRTFAFHGDDRAGNVTTNYLAVVGPETVWQPTLYVSDKDVTDGISSTILFVENGGAGVHWMEPRDLSFAEMDFTINNALSVSSKYDDPAVAMLSGCVLRLRKNLAPKNLRALLTIRGGESITCDGEWDLLPEGRPREAAK